MSLDDRMLILFWIPILLSELSKPLLPYDHLLSVLQLG